MLIKIFENTSGFLAFQVDIAFGQFQKILFAFAKRRQFQSEDIDAVQQILTERAIFYCGLHVFIGSSDDPDIDRDHLASAKTHDFPFLNDSQKSCLKIDSHISDFIEKQSAIMGKLKQIVCVSATPGDLEKSESALIAEQVIRPTGLLDPEIDVRPVEGQIDDLIGEINARTAKGGGPDRLS